MANGIDSYVIAPTPVGVFNLGSVMTALPAGRRLWEKVLTASGHELMLVKAGATIADGVACKFGDASDGVVIPTASAYDATLGVNPPKGASVTTAAPYFWLLVGPAGATVTNAVSADSVAENTICVASATAGTFDTVGTIGTAGASAFTAAIGMVVTPSAQTAGGKLTGRILKAGA